MTPPAAHWIRFLRNYGPLPTNGNLFDEHINAALKRAQVRPIELPTPSVDAMAEKVAAGEVRSILIAGTAGDGKTYHARKLWERLGGDPKGWDRHEKTKTLELAGGRALTFVKDLSELTPEQGLAVLAGLESSALEPGHPVGYVIACNHGQILDRLRTFRSPADGSASRLLDDVQRAFLEPGRTIPGLMLNDLGGATQRHSFRAVIKAVTEHPDWSHCDGCQLNAGDRQCPIAANRRRAMGADDAGLFISRLEDLIDLARLNGAHLPMRDLLALVANMLLGHPDAKDNLMTCGDVARLQEERLTDRASIYRNVFGANLGHRRAMARTVFRTLGSFGIGEESTNTIDGLLVYGQHDQSLRIDFDRLVANDRVYGAGAGYLTQQAQYLEGDESAREEQTAAAFVQRLSDQRQRLFFTLPAEDAAAYPFWSLSMFRFAGDYLALQRCCEQNLAVSPHVRGRMVRGLNRVMTGLLLDNTDTIFIASSGGFSQSKISVLCDTEVPAKRVGNGAGLRLRFDQITQRPAIEVHVAPGAAASVKFDLTPVRFEFICRVAEGALPSSFSNECYEDLLAFKVRLLRKAEHVRQQQMTEHDSEPGEPTADAGELQLAFIEIEENGSGFLKRVTVGAGA
ncbi:hypothetical protein [Methylibium petroleiphilum]|uniref:Uncharacterized protein n=1 Tax=Methylibium petroleiphilum (strain ATCC BAA-1232 / LMG 22953 / PM1) TaxID=420662 RepID=A2SF08_METPP|nr:hypothetical protein [Methylibium petroleiphilum]ABM94147.1 hypothetical protein Mpe_A1185 [Methylibium petroleiphilum PM1]ABM96955.1 hypothetical protein Mpe_B0179 [Methylibium petroleiphilum PM1]